MRQLTRKHLPFKWRWLGELDRWRPRRTANGLQKLIAGKADKGNGHVEKAIRRYDNQARCKRVEAVEDFYEAEETQKEEEEWALVGITFQTINMAVKFDDQNEENKEDKKEESRKIRMKRCSLFLSFFLPFFLVPIYSTGFWFPLEWCRFTHGRGYLQGGRGVSGKDKIQRTIFEDTFQPGAGAGGRGKGGRERGKG